METLKGLHVVMVEAGIQEGIDAFSAPIAAVLRLFL